ncbi:MAG TPA: hypothetical protein VEW92_05615 [Nitrososphaeraceae archaeon]|jgi:hypothetical protein|nr:hypothetical protein [Nitrososphaeraceae archaeon]
MINSKEKLSGNKNKKPSILIGMIFVILTIGIGSIHIFNQMIAYAQEEGIESNSEKMIKMSSSIPQPNSNSTILDVKGSNALFQPAVGLTNVFGPEGVFPFTETFKCADALTCGVSAGDDAKFIGKFEEGNTNKTTSYEATYTSPITYGSHQIKGHVYKIILTDTDWNSPDASLPTENAEFAASVNNVGTHQIQHGASNIDRSDVPQLSNLAFLYGHAKIIDVTNGNNTVVAEDIFTHVMVGHLMDENVYYKNLRDEALTPNLALVFAVNIPNDTELPGVGMLSAEEAQSFTPLSSDPSLENSPPFNYPIEFAEPRTGNDNIKEPSNSQSSIWPVANQKQPPFFTFLLFQEVEVKYSQLGR